MAGGCARDHFGLRFRPNRPLHAVRRPHFANLPRSHLGLRLEWVLHPPRSGKTTLRRKRCPVPLNVNHAFKLSCVTGEGATTRLPSVERIPQPELGKGVGFHQVDEISGDLDTGELPPERWTWTRTSQCSNQQGVSPIPSRCAGIVVANGQKRGAGRRAVHVRDGRQPVGSVRPTNWCGVFLFRFGDGFPGTSMVRRSRPARAVWRSECGGRATQARQVGQP